MRNLFTVFAVTAGVCFSRPSSAVDWGKIIDASGGSKVMFGVSLGSSPPFERNLDLPFAPASNSKIFTATAAIEKLGANFTYPTLLEWQDDGAGSASQVTLTGYGDPSWGLSELGEGLQTRVDQIAQSFAAQGIHVVHGEIETAAHDPRWENLRYPEGWETSDTIGCDGALAQAFNLNIDCGTYVISSPTQGKWSEPGLAQAVQLEIQSGKTTSLKVALLDPNHPASGFLISGTLKAGAHPVYILPVLDMKDWIKNLLALSFQAHGIQLQPARAASAPRAPRQIVFNSPALSLIIKAMMKNSINLIGDAIFKTLAANLGSPGDPDLIHSAQQFLRDYLLVQGMPNDFTLYDGAGLSRMSVVTPRLMLAFLNHIKGLSGFQAIWDSLPIAGVDGTLKARMKGTAAANRLRAKTGTLNGVYNLSGFLPVKGGYIPFVMLSKTTTAEINVAHAAQDRVGVQLATSYKGVESMIEGEPFPFVIEHAGRDGQ